MRRLSTRISLVFGGISGAILALVALSAFLFVRHAATQKVESELAATAQMFEELWQRTDRQLSEQAAIMARDFGFREAVATGDAATIASALDNLLSRLELDLAVLVYPDGALVGTLPAGSKRLPPDVLTALAGDNPPQGVLKLAGTAFQTVAVPVMAPDRVGWVLFGLELDAESMNRLAELAAIPLSAELVGSETRAPAHHSIEATRPVASFTATDASALRLNYPRAEAMAPFSPMFLAIGVVSAAGLCALLLTAWLLARGVTRPIRELDVAAHRLARGEDVRVDIQSTDEIGRLADSFGEMAETIRARENQITLLSQTDVDTSLPNRRALDRHLAELDARGRGASSWIVAVAVDRFVRIRSVIGISVANELLAVVGQRLMIQPEVIGIGRIATDTIGLVIDAASDAGAEAAVGRIVAGIERSVVVRGEVVDVDLTTGLAPIDPTTTVSPIDRALIAVDQARAARVPLAQFDRALYGDPSGTLSLMSEMISGLGDGSVFLAYQPKLDLRTGTIHAAEALLRWQHKDRGFIRPDVFVQYSEETGHIRPLTEWVIRQAAADRGRFLAAGQSLKLSVNLSGRLITDQAFIELIIDCFGADAHGFCLEITETSMVSNTDDAAANITRLHAAGIDISIDDYGTGLSSLSYLKAIDAQELKIDKSFVAALERSQADRLLVKSTIDLAKQMGMRVTAEGVESEAVLEILRLFGADEIQGYLISRPKTLPEVLEFLRAHEAATQTAALRAANF